MPANLLERSGLFPNFALEIERFFFRRKSLLLYVHLTMFVFFLLLIVVPPFLPDPPEHATAFQSWTVFARRAIWGLWFPLVFASVIFSGRSWCGLLCPMGAASEWMNGIGRQRNVPRWIEHPATPILSFLLITIWGQLIGVRDHPEAIAIVFGSTLAAALLTGFLWGKAKRVWCRHLCPIGLMLGVFSRLGAVQFIPKRRVAGPERPTDRTACPTRIPLHEKTESRHCIACFRCVSPDAKGGLYFKLHWPGSEIVQIGSNKANLSEVLFICLSTGASLGGFLWLTLPLYQHLRHVIGDWLIDHNLMALLQPGPYWLVSVHPARREVFLWLDAITISGFMIAVMLGLSAVMLGCVWLVTRVTHNEGKFQTSFKRRFIELGYFLAPVAMISLLLGLGGGLFNLLAAETSQRVSHIAEIGLMIIGVAWSLGLSQRILKEQGVTHRASGMGIALFGSLLVALSWWPAIF